MLRHPATCADSAPYACCGEATARGAATTEALWQHAATKMLQVRLPQTAIQINRSFTVSGTSHIACSV